MMLIVGLGNPEARFDGTRHNIGFCVIDALADKYGIQLLEKSQKSLLGSGSIEGAEVVLLKPQTYMNSSGESIVEVLKKYNISPETEMIVVYDDISLDVGRIRVRGRGRAGGHNGVKSIIECIESEEFKRVKVGVGENPPGVTLIEHVLGQFSKEEEQDIAAATNQAVCATVSMMTSDISVVANQYHKR